MHGHVELLLAVVLHYGPTKFGRDAVRPSLAVRFGIEYAWSLASVV